MLGCIGTAPEEGQVISTETSGATGGNMDYIGVREGAVLYFPVCVPGALLYLGDGHATQSHGEIGGTGTEVSMEIQVRLQVIKHRAIGWPRGLSEAHIFTIGNARPLEQALRLATTEIFSWLADDLEMDASYVSLLLTQAAEYEVANVFDPAYSVVCKLSRALLPDKFRSGGMSPY
jgi:acetamidase/formamidase